jgi:pyruvate/2-oxoglutarate dehydrogenase complex dihydrolipoamide dehydrogenase (E3) component
MVYPPADGIRVEPSDRYDRELVANVRPVDWVDPEPRARYHLVVIGGGTGGLVTAAIAAGLGARVALLERHLMGGDCLNVGCVPSKGVIAAARSWQAVADSSRLFGGPGVAGPGDFGEAMARMRRIRAGLSRVDGAARFRELGVDVFLGEGGFTARDEVTVNGRRLRFRRAVVATGARPVVPPIPGLEDAGYLTNETIFDLTELPRRLVVLGAGPVGCELAQAFARLGSKVTLVGRRAQILPREDADAAGVVERAMGAHGVRVLLRARVARAEARAGERVVQVFVGFGEIVQS